MHASNSLNGFVGIRLEGPNLPAAFFLLVVTARQLAPDTH